MRDQGPDSTQTVAIAAIARPLLVSEIDLVIVEGSEKGRKQGPLLPPIRIGASEANEVVLADPTVSRFHCAIEAGPQGLTVKDSGSRNGTFVGPYRVEQAYVPPGAPIRVGATVFTLQPTATQRVVEMSADSAFGPLRGKSAKMRALFATLARLVRADAPVLIEGETGTGKELVARALHQMGPKKAQPFVTVDCGAVAPSLIESELFGHERGAFTGADVARAGAFEAASRGTIFLDEIGELPLAVQPKLLRVLEAGTIRRVGATEEKKVSVRVISATHRDLQRMVNEGTFREDLYFRLAVCLCAIPPLRERLDDLPLLASVFYERSLLANMGQASAPVLDDETLGFLRAQAWTGNVRELRNAIERAVILGEPDEVAAGRLGPALRSLSATARRGADVAALPLEEARRRFEIEYLTRLLSRHTGDLRAAAAEADVHPKSLERLLRRYGLKRL